MTTISAPSTRDKISVSFLVASNIVPLIGVLFWDWNVGSILLMYWFENIVIGVYNAVKMAMSPLGKEEPQYVTDTTLKWSLIGFFVLHYGGFCAGHGVFVYLLYFSVPLVWASMEFTNNYFGVRSIGMGSAFSALAEGPESIFYKKYLMAR